MGNLRVKGTSEDGQYLVLLSDDGDEFTLPISDEVRAAVRHARVRVMATAPAERHGSLSPREIQQRIRSGLNAAELAELTGEPVENLRKFEAPVIAERAYVAESARQTRIGRDAGAPLLGELVIDRLASRNVDADAVQWDAWREFEEPWRVSVEFPTGGKKVRAVWTFDQSSRSLVAEDEESRWLSETELLDVPIPRRHLASVPTIGEDQPRSESRPPAVTQVHAPVTPEEPVSETELLLEDLNARRGSRDAAEIEEDDDEDGGFTGFGPASRVRSAEVSFSPKSADEAHAEAEIEEEPAAPQPAKPASNKRGRASIPSWDEIVFGTKSE